jgi:signal transduction histidine kinase
MDARGRSLVLLRALAGAVFLWVALACGGAEVGPASLEPVARRILQYALTSANDFPQRDPQDWRLLGSNDDGTSWTTLDTRKGEVFFERHQRRVFKVSTPGEFTVYRLQIERVRDPGAADCVQLAELEPLGDQEDELAAVPTFEDLITAQGENGPMERRADAFDGRLETKWLDHAAGNPNTRASWLQWQYLKQANLVITNLHRLAALRSRARNGYTVRLEGVVVGRLASNVCLLDGTGYLELSEVRGQASAGVGQRVLLLGTTRWENQKVSVAQAHLEVPGPAAPTQPRRITLEQPLTAADDFQWVEVEGQPRFCTSVENQLSFELEENNRSVLVHVLQLGGGEAARLSEGRVRVRGLCEGVLSDNGERVAGILWVASLRDITAAERAGPPLAQPRSGVKARGSDGPLLTSIEQIRRLTPQELAQGPRVQVRGVVTELFGAFIQEEMAGIEVWFRGESAARPPGFGVYVQLEGKADWAFGHGPIIRTDKVTTLGKGKLPKPEHCTWSQLANGKLPGQWVELEGVVRATDGSHLLLTSEGGQWMATIRSAAVASVKQLVDSTVRIRGVNVAATDSRGQVQGVQILAPSLDYVAVEEPAPEPFSLPVRPIGSVLQVHGPREFIHRVKIQGVLTLRDDRKYYLQDKTGGLMAIPHEEVILNSPAGGWSWVFWQSTSSNTLSKELDFVPGDELQVAGFPETRGFSPVLTEVLMRKVARSALTRPVNATVEQIAAGGLDSMLLSIEAVLLRQESVGPDSVFELESGERVFQASLRGGVAAGRAIAVGSRVRVTGVCQVDPLPFAELGKRVASFKLLVGSPADVLVLERPPWLTLRRVLLLTGILLVVLGLAGAWIGILRRQVEERTKQLQQEIEQHKITESRLARETKLLHLEMDERQRIEAEVERGHKQLLKASRLAGMAEVATSVLHNVGNVLNSVNVLASLIVEQVQHSKVPSVGRLGNLLRQQQGDIGRFMVEEHIPGYVERLGTHLAQEQGRMLEKTRALTESIQHIKEIVAMQQNYAKVSGVQETVLLSEIVDDALRIHDGGMVRHRVQVVRDYQPAPPVTVDRHKVLQILFNLLENAKCACDDCTGAEKHVRVEIRNLGDARVQVRVSDNGMGIPAENLRRVFDQDFSTRKGGHGFGLHSSRLAAQDMGAALTAHSDGPGLGAAFELEIPVGMQPAQQLNSRLVETI